jgi:hypothetical protein
MVEHIRLTHECYEVFNAFPCLHEVLSSMDIDSTKLQEGDSVYDFFKSLEYKDSEIDHILSKLNFELSHFLKTGKLNDLGSGNKDKTDDSLDIEMIV